MCRHTHTHNQWGEKNVGIKVKVNTKVADVLQGI